MTKISIEQDMARPAGGFAFIVIQDVEQAPENLGFSIGNEHDSACVDKAGKLDWQNSPACLRPRAYKYEAKTLFLQIGPELVVPVLPGIYRISVPSLELSERIAWPVLNPGPDGHSEPLQTWDSNPSLPPRLQSDKSAPAPEPELVSEPAPIPVPEPAPEPVRNPEPQPVSEPVSNPVQKPNPEPVPVSSKWKLMLFVAGCLAGVLLSAIFSRDDEPAPTNRDTSTLQRQLDDARTERDNLRDQLADASSSRDSQRQTINRLNRELTEAGRANTELRDQLSGISNSNSSQQQTINRLNQELAEASSANTELREQLDDARTEIDNLHDQLASAQASLAPQQPSRPSESIISAAIDRLKAENPDRISTTAAERLKQLIIREGKSGEDALTELFGPTKWTLNDRGSFCAELGAACE